MLETRATICAYLSIVISDTSSKELHKLIFKQGLRAHTGHGARTAGIASQSGRRLQISIVARSGELSISGQGYDYVALQPHLQNVPRGHPPSYRSTRKSAWAACPRRRMPGPW